MLDILLNLYAEIGKSQTALDILESDYHLPLRSVRKEVENMCNLSQGVYDEGVISKAVEVVKNLLAKGFSLEEALTIADIDKKTYEEHNTEE